MKLSEILKEQGLFSRDIKIRINNKKMMLNGEPIEGDIDIEFEKIFDAGEFISQNCEITKLDVILSNLIGGIDFLFNATLNNVPVHTLTKMFRLLNQHQILRISKKEIFVLTSKK